MSRGGCAIRDAGAECPRLVAAVGAALFNKDLPMPTRILLAHLAHMNHGVDNFYTTHAEIAEAMGMLEFHVVRGEAELLAQGHISVEPLSCGNLYRTLRSFPCEPCDGGAVACA